MVDSGRCELWRGAKAGSMRSEVQQLLSSTVPDNDGNLLIENLVIGGYRFEARLCFTGDELWKIELSLQLADGETVSSQIVSSLSRLYSKKYGSVDSEKSDKDLWQRQWLHLGTSIRMIAYNSQGFPSSLTVEYTESDSVQSIELI